MNRRSLIFYIALILIILLPNSFGKFIFNLAGSVFVLSLIVPLILTVIGWLSWKSISSKSNICNECGATFFSKIQQCPLCGAENIYKDSKEKYIINNGNMPASDATIDVVAETKD